MDSMDFTRLVIRKNCTLCTLNKYCITIDDLPTHCTNTLSGLDADEKFTQVINVLGSIVFVVISILGIYLSLRWMYKAITERGIVTNNDYEPLV